jgi:hypothetical protein
VNHGEVLVSSPPLDEFIQVSMLLEHEEENVVSCNLFQVFDDALCYDSKSGEALKGPLNSLGLSCYNESDDFIENIDEFIHVGRRKWDVICYDGDSIYNMEGHFQLFPLHVDT